MLFYFMELFYHCMLNTCCGSAITPTFGINLYVVISPSQFSFVQLSFFMKLVPHLFVIYVYIDMINVANFVILVSYGSRSESSLFDVSLLHAIVYWKWPLNAMSPRGDFVWYRHTTWPSWHLIELMSIIDCNRNIIEKLPIWRVHENINPWGKWDLT